MCFQGMSSLCLVKVGCPCGCCACLYDFLINMFEEVFEVDVEVELGGCRPGVLFTLSESGVHYALRRLTVLWLLA